MQILFYPNHEFRCAHVGHCPHLGGAALGTLVTCANQNQQVYEAQLRTVHAQCACQSQFCVPIIGKLIATVIILFLVIPLAALWVFAMFFFMLRWVIRGIFA